MRDKNAPKWKVSSWVSGNVGSNGCLSERECVRVGVGVCVCGEESGKESL